MLADAAGGVGGGTWNHDGVLVFAANGGLYRVSASGGGVSPVLSDTSSDPGRTLAFPQFLPDGDRFIYVVLRSATDAKATGVWASSLSHPEDTRRRADDSVQGGVRSFIVQQLLPQSAAPPLTVILNWTTLLKK